MGEGKKIGVLGPRQKKRDTKKSRIWTRLWSEFEAADM